MVILRWSFESKQEHYLRMTNVHLMFHRKNNFLVENDFILINRITQNIDKEYECFSK